MSLESILTIPALAELGLSALEDATDHQALAVPGLRQPVRRGRSVRERQGELVGRIQTLRDHQPRAASPLADLETKLLTLLTSPAGLDLAAWWAGFAQVLAQAEGVEGDRLAPFEAHFEITAAGGGELRLQARTQAAGTLAAQGLVGRVTEMCAAYRAAGTRRLHVSDQLALLRAYQLVEMGARPTPPMQPIRTDLLRPCPTYLSFADPGPGHLWTTVRDGALLRGTIVHIETIDREGIADPRQIEAYRIPSIRDVARLRVHVGDAAPCSVYVGRPVFEGLTRDELADPARRRSFQQSLLKTAHTVAAACSGLFALGVAECKIGLDGLTARQAVDYLQALTGNVIRDRFTQRLSAAFNLNTPVLDDRDEARGPREVQGRVNVGRLGILLAKRGGVEKVTWDGAATGESRPILGQLTRVELFELVHEAHERGLETYISAGMTDEHMPAAVEVGVGGVGIGTKLHATADNGTITHVLPDRVRAVLEARDRALQRPAGQAAAALAQLDWRHAIVPLPPEQDAVRQELCTRLRAYHAAVDTAPPAGNDVARQRAEDELQKALTNVNVQLGELIRPLGVPSRAPAPGAEDPVFSVAQQVLECEARSQETLSSDARMLRRLLDARDAEGLRYWLGV